MQRKISFSEGEYYHVYNRGVEKRDVFMNDHDRQRFQKLLYLCNTEKHVVFRLVQGGTLYATPLKKSLCAVGAYTLMPNHFHLLLKETREGGITEFLRKLTTAYTMYFNKTHKRVGPLFQGVFKAEHVNEDDYLKYLYAYIHLNPLKYVDKGWNQQKISAPIQAEKFLKEYAFSSYCDYAGVKRNEVSILSPKEFPDYFSHQSFRVYIRDWVDLRGNSAPQENRGE